ncbi:putative zinc finger protein, partial [Orchesella cincta]
MPNKKDCKCPVCDKRFSSSAGVKQHLNTHTGERPFKCTQCVKAFSCPGDLRSHQVVHIQNRERFPCSQCSASLATKANLRVHVWMVHRKDESLNKECNICQKLYAKNADLFEHMRTHTGEKPYQCIFCKRRFAKSSILYCHFRGIHINEKPWFCSECPLSFSQSCGLKFHVNRGAQPRQKVSVISALKAGRRTVISLNFSTAVKLQKTWIF